MNTVNTNTAATPTNTTPLQLFTNSQFGNLRTLVIDNEPWFVGKDVAETSGYSNASKSIKDHIDSEDKGVTKCYNPGGIQQMTVINESGLYSLILSSKLPTAKQFKHWVTAFLSLAYIPALCVHVQSRIVSVCSGVETSTCQYKMDHRAKYEVNCCLSRIKSKKRLICCGFCRSINCVIFKYNYYLTCCFCSKIVINFNPA